MREDVRVISIRFWIGVSIDVSLSLFPSSSLTMFSLPFASRAAFGALVKPMLAPRVAVPRAVALPRFYATVIIADGKSPKAPKAAKKKPAAKKAPAKTKATKPKTKPKPWELVGPDGRKVPLPKDTKPTFMGPFLLYLKEMSVKHNSDPAMTKTSAKTGEQVLDIAKLAKRMGEQWKSLSESEQAPYREESRKAREVYHEAMEKWRSSLTAEDIKRQRAYNLNSRKTGGRRTAVPRAPGQPVRPVSAFFRFLEARRREGNFVGRANEASQSAAADWRTMTPEERAPYEKAAAEDLERFRQENQAFLASQ